MTSVLILLAASFLFGVTNKLADMLNEHGLKAPTGVATLMGPVWGFFGIVLVTWDSRMAVAYISVVLAWILERKLDHANHAIAGVLMLVAGLAVAQNQGVNLATLIAMVAAYYLSWLGQAAARRRWPSSQGFWRLRLRIYLIPAVYSIWVADPLPIASTLAGMAGVELVTNYYRVARGLP